MEQSATPQPAALAAKEEVVRTHAASVIWEKMTVREVRDALHNTQTVLIPIGVTEQHGYHLALNTDMHNAWQMSVRAAAEYGCFVAPMLPYTFLGRRVAGDDQRGLPPGRPARHRHSASPGRERLPQPHHRPRSRGHGELPRHQGGRRALPAPAPGLRRPQGGGLQLLGALRGLRPSLRRGRLPCRLRGDLADALLGPGGCAPERDHPR